MLQENPNPEARFSRTRKRSH